MNEIEEDLIKRDVRLVGVLVQTNDGKFQVIGYDANNNVNYICDPQTMLEIYKRNENGTITSLATIGKTE